ncbi:MAG: hypothetical protein ACK5RG_09590 [Cyclobacteriaceae bacterium]|nr:hypothetical protein [Flammeovirgaceae bacterium]
MKKLEDIPKAQPFQVPDNYFEDLPMRIQARIQEPERKSVWAGEWGLALKLAIPVLVIGIGAVIFWPSAKTDSDPLANLDSVPTSELLAYLESDEISTEEILENGSFTTTSFSDVDPTSTIEDKDMNEFIQQYDFNF